MVDTIMVSFWESDIGNFTATHSAHDNLIVLVITDILHLELLVNFASLREVNQLTIIMACLMSIVNIICVLDDCARPLM